MNNVSFPFIPKSFNMAAHVLAHADRLADKVALAVLSPTGARRWNYREIKSAVLGIAQGFLDLGAQRGDRVLMRLGNSVEFPLTYLAAIAVDLVPVPTSAQLTEPEVEKMIADLAPAIIVRDPAVACPDTPIRTLTLAQLQDMQTNSPAEFVYGDPDRLGYIVYTSGTSGNPRAVMHAHRAILARQMMISDWYDLNDTDRLLHAGAFNWTFTLGTGLMDPWTVGATALIPQAGLDPKALPLLLRRHDATIFAAAPGVYRKILSDLMSPQTFPKLRHGLSAGEKLSPMTAAAWETATHTPVYEAFGMSECSTFISSSPKRAGGPDVLGYPQQGRRVAILPIDQGDTAVPPNTEGIIAIHKSDPGLMLGYLNAPSETAQKFRGDWFLTGDHGMMRDDGAIIYLGRRDDMMNAGGFRVSPIEVEAQLATHPQITSVAVTDIEIKPDTWVIAAYYTAEAPIDPQELNQFCQSRLARYKQPRLFVHLDALPQSPNGKIQRAALKQIKE